MAGKKRFLTDDEVAKMRDIEAYTHDDKKRSNNPPVGMAQHDKAEETMKTYAFDLSPKTVLDPQMLAATAWTGRPACPGHFKHNRMR